MCFRSRNNNFKIVGVDIYLYFFFICYFDANLFSTKKKKKKKNRLQFVKWLLTKWSKLLHKKPFISRKTTTLCGLCNEFLFR